MDLLKSIFKGDKVIWIIFLFLCLISITEVFSAASTLTYKSGDHWGPITQHSILLMVGAVIVVLVHNIPYKWFQVFPVFLLPISIGLLAFVMLMGFITGDRVNGAARWMTFMGIQFQPSEIAKMAVVIVTAFILSKGQDEDGASPKAFKRIMIITCIVCGLILPENYSTGMLLFGTVYLMMFIGRVSARKLLILGGGIVAFVTVFVAFLLATPDKTLENIPMGHRFTTVKSRIADFTNKEDLKVLGQDIRYIKMGETSLTRKGDFFFGSTTYYLWYIIPLVLFVVFVIVYRKKAIENANVAKVRTKKANKVAAKRMKNAGKLLTENKQEAFYDEVLKALWGYISDKLNIPVSQLSKDNIEDELTQYGVAPELIKDFIGTLNECEFARYAPGNQNEAMDKVYSSAVEVISKMENSIKH